MLNQNTPRIKRYDELEFTDDFMFAQVMRGEPELCRLLLEALLGMEIQEIRYLKTQETIDNRLDAKAVRMDVIAKDNRSIYNVEMQVSNQKTLPRRSRYYQSQLDIDSLQKGNDYDSLPDTYIIFLCTFDPFDKGKCLYRFKNICTTDPSLSLEDGATKLFVNSKGTDSPDEVLRELFSYMNNPQNCVPRQQLTKQIQSKVQWARQNPEWRQTYMKYQLDLMDARREGIQQAWNDIALRLFQAGQSLEFISDLVENNISKEDLLALEKLANEPPKT